MTIRLKKAGQYANQFQELTITLEQVKKPNVPAQLAILKTVNNKIIPKLIKTGRFRQLAAQPVLEWNYDTDGEMAYLGLKFPYQLRLMARSWDKKLNDQTLLTLAYHIKNL